MSSSVSSLFSVLNKNVLITGASRGIGLMLARGLTKQGANVLITSRSEKDLVEATTSVGSPNCRYVRSDVSTREGCETLALRTSDLFSGRLDILINNAGTSWGEDVDRTSGRMNWGWDKVLDLNVKGLFYLSRACAGMLERKDNGDPGRIINIGSVAGFVPQEAPTHAYDVSKAAVHHLTKKMAGDFGARNITVNAVAPGYVKTRMSDGLAAWVEGDPEEKIGTSIPLGRMGNEDDMVGACVYLSSRAGAWCTGVILNVDGGTVGALQIPLSSL